MTTIDFGKYAGKEVFDIFESDRAYCQWMLQEATGHDEVITEVARLIKQEARLDTAEYLLRLGRLAYGDLAEIQSGGDLTEKQGQRFMNVVQAAVEAGIIEMED